MTNAKKHAKKKQHWRGNWHFRVQWQSALPALALLCFAAKFGMAQSARPTSVASSQASVTGSTGSSGVGGAHGSANSFRRTPSLRLRLQKVVQLFK